MTETPLEDLEASVDFAVKYDGPALRDNRMDVRDLAPALLALADVFREANTVLHPENAPVTLEIRATEAGSFNVDLSVVAANAVAVLAGTNATALVNLKDLLLMPQGLFRYIVERRARRAEPQPDGSVKLIDRHGGSIEFPAEVLNLHKSVKVRESTQAFLRPLRQSGIDRVDFIEGATREVTVSVGRDDVAAFDAPAVIEDGDRQLVHSYQASITIELVSLSFHEGNKWRFSDGASEFWANIDDAGFLEKIDRNEIRFGKGDMLRAVVRVEQYRENGKLRQPDRTVVDVEEVIAARPPTPPPALPFPDTDDEPSTGEPDEVRAFWWSEDDV